MTKRNRIIYWIATIWLALGMVSSGIMQLLNYKTGGGGYLKLFKIFGIDKSPFPVTKKSSLQSYLPHFTKGQTIFLIHNTFMPEEDIVFANQYADQNGLKLVYCLCPNANLYI